MFLPCRFLSWGPTIRKSTISQKNSLLCSSIKPSLSPFHITVPFPLSLSVHVAFCISFPPPVLFPVEAVTHCHKLFLEFGVSEGIVAICSQAHIHPEFYERVRFIAFGTCKGHLSFPFLAPGTFFNLGSQQVSAFNTLWP